MNEMKNIKLYRMTNETDSSVVVYFLEGFKATRNSTQKVL